MINRVEGPLKNEFEVNLAKIVDLGIIDIGSSEDLIREDLP